MHPALTPEAAAAICRHMNEDHADAIAGYARTFGHIADVTSAEMLAIDTFGMDLRVDTGKGEPLVTHIPFDHPLADAGDARDTLIAMARVTPE